MIPARAALTECPVARTAFWALAVIITWCLFAGAAAAATEEVLTNDAIVQMVRAGLPESIILAKIRSSKSKFDTSTDTLIALKQAGVPDKVLEAMVTAGAPPTAGAAPPPPPAQPGRAPTPAAPPVAAVPQDVATQMGLMQGRAPIYHLMDGKPVELLPTVGEIQSNFVFFFQKSELVLPGRRAKYRIMERQPGFLSSYSPSEAVLVRLDPGKEHDDRNLKTSSGSALPFMGVSQRHGVRGEDKVEVEAERDSGSSYRIKPRQPLEPGEYGFILTHGFAGASTGKVYDFGVD